MAFSGCPNPSVVLGKKLLDALGIRHTQPWQRVVIVADVQEGLPRVYVKGVLLPSDATYDGIVRAVKDVLVDDDGNVTIAE